MPQKRSRGRSPISPLHQGRKQRSRPSAKKSESKSESQRFETVFRTFVDTSLRHYTDKQAESQRRGGSVRGEQESSGRRRHLDTSDVAKLVLGQVAQFLIHKYLANRAKTAPEQQASQGSPPNDAPQTSTFPEPVAPRAKHGDKNRDLNTSLDAVLVQLQATEDLVQRTMYRPASHNGCRFHRNIIASADELQAAISTSSSQIKHLQRQLGQVDGREDRVREDRSHRRGENASYYHPDTS